MECALREAVKFQFGKDDLKGMKVAVMGLGAVGFPQAEYLLADGAELIVCDLEESVIKELKDKHPDAKIDHDKQLRQQIRQNPNIFPNRFFVYEQNIYQMFCP